MLLMKQDLTDLFVEVGRDWPSGAVHLALKRKGTSLSDIESELGVKEGSARNVFYGDYTRADELLRLNPDLDSPNKIAGGTVINAWAK